MLNKVFFPQSALDVWLADATVDLVDSEIAVAASGQKFKVVEGVRVLKELTGAGDPHELVGKVRARASLVELGAELLEDSMILGDHAYEVSLGWLGAIAQTKGEMEALHQLQASVG